MDKPQLIDDPATLEEALNRLAQTEWFAIDTEFIREETYWPRLCLVQIATPDFIACIDPLALDDLGGLFALMEDPGITKVFHAAGQDLEIFHHLTGKVPAPVFDTQVAAPLLGHPAQAGFGRLVSALLDIELEKGHQRTDWSRRPLPADALAYAADDVRYLVPLYQQIHAELAERGRLEWLEPEFARLTDPARYDPPAADAWQRVKGGDRLPDRGRATLQVLAEWRENTARDQDVPRGRIARDDVLVDIARSQPKSRDQLGRMRSVRGPLIDRHGDRLLELVSEARQTKPPLPAKRGRQVTLDAAGEALADALSAVIRLRAEDVDLNPASLASRKDLARIASGEAAHDVLAGWRAGLVADRLDALACGRSALRVQQGHLTVLDA